MEETQYGTNWEGMTVLDKQGEKIGSISQIYVDDATGKPEWGSVSSGFLGTSSHLVPLAGATPQGDTIQAAVTKEQVKNSPSVTEDHDLSQSEEAQLFEYYGIPYGGETATSQGAPGMGTQKTQAGSGGSKGMQLHEEELRVGRIRRPSQLVRLKKRVETEPVSQRVGLQREEARIQREPVEAGAKPSEHAFQEQEQEITLHQEEAVVEKKAVPKERVYAAKEQVTEEREISGELRKERVDVEQADAE